MRKAPAAALLVLALAALPGSTQNGSVSLSSAVTTAQQGTGGGLVLLYARSETKNGVPVWGMYFLAPNKQIVEKEITKSSGAVLLNQNVDSIDDPGPGVPPDAPPAVVNALNARVRAKLPNNRYLQIAQDKNGGQANGFALILSGDQLLVQVSGTGANGNAWQTTMDMGTGQIVGGRQ